MIPALIVSGWLGSGKTTLVGHVLEHARANGVRLAIVSNEFGDTGIDKALLEAGEEGFVELDGGCVCCRLSDALGATIEAIVTAARPDRLILETSGVALPGDVLVQFWRPPIADLIEDEVVVVVVDAERLHATPDDALDETFLAQVEAADLLLLNKCDLVDQDAIRACTARLDALTGGQPVLQAVHGQVDPDLLFPPDPERLGRRDPNAVRPPHTHDRFTTKELRFDDGTEGAAVLDVVRAEGAVRAKGFVRTPEGLKLLQGVDARIELTDPGRDIPAHLVGRVVIIHRQEGHDDHH